ncbi:hypothetical protein EZS27_022713 [termite gut metagenome]|uniref:Uncharacterized protein n=1 Tax=termite gut metagenome TaxID=433724 RepID=A0A5J4R3T3_9ZZZZ
MIMQVFINECSLHGQYAEHNIEGAIRNFIGTLKFINDFKIAKNMFRAQYFFDVYKAFEDEHLGTILKQNPSLKSVFFENIKSVSKWEDSKVHDSSAKYIFENDDYVGTSIAELTERKIQNRQLKGVLINFQESKFENKEHIEICKNRVQCVHLNCPFDEGSVLKCFIDNGIINPNEDYDITSRHPPRDYQTILRDESTFKLTTYFNQSRRVYERINHDDLWVVDNFHYGKDAHIEIFDKTTGNHLGTSSYNAVKIETKYKKNDRNLFL